MIYHQQQHKTTMMEQDDERLANIMRLRWERQKQKLLKYLKDNPRTTKTIVSALPIMAKHAGYFAMLPVNLDLQAHLQRYPLTRYMFVNDNGHIRTVNTKDTFGSYFDLERMIHILGLITSGRADKKHKIDESRFVPFHSKRIRNYFKDYLSYLDYLEKTGIVICDGYYIIEEKPYRLKLAPKYDNVPLRPYYYSYFKPSDVNPLEEQVYNKITDLFERNTLLDMSYLNHWYYQKKIEINPLAEEYAFYLWQSKKGIDDSDQSLWDETDVWDVEKCRFKKKDPKTQYDAIINNIKRLKIHQYKAMIDANVHRLNSVLTYMHSEYRNFLTYDGGQQLVCIDLKNSHPYMLCLLLNREFWEENSSLPINFYNLPSNVQALFTSSSEILPTIRGFFKNLNERNYQEFHAYIPLAASGRLYDDIVERALQIRDSQINRKKAKKNLLILFYSPNRDDVVDGKKRRIFIVEKVFREKFPTIMELIRLIRNDYDGSGEGDGYKRFSCLLQSVESEIVLHGCCFRIWEDANHQVPIFTIHDSIVTTTEYFEYVWDVMMQELTACIGVPPTLEAEEWNVANLHQTIPSPIPTNTTPQISTDSHPDDVYMSELSSLFDDIS